MSRLLKYCLFLCWCPSVIFAQYRATEWEQRDVWQNSKAILGSLELTAGMSVADIGCHEGYLTMKLAPLVGASGMVWAVDVDKQRLDKLDQRLHQSSIKHVRTVLGDYDDPKLPASSQDAVVILDAYHEMDHYSKILRHIYLALKPGGRLVLVEPIAKDRLQWTRKKQAGKHEIALRYALGDLKAAGFIIKSKKDPFIDRPSKSDRMWMVVALKPRS